jgi:hypothetical protein
VLVVALSQRPQEAADLRLGHLAHVVDPPVGEMCEVATQVPAIRLQRVVGHPALHDEVVEVGTDRPLQRGRGSGRGAAQPRTPSSETLLMPWASPTGA